MRRKSKLGLDDEDNEVEETIVADMVDETLDTDPPLFQNEINGQPSNYLLSYSIDKKIDMEKEIVDKATVLGNAVFSDEITQLETSCQCYTHFITKDFINILVE